MILYLGNKLSSHGLSPTSVELLAPRLSRLGFNLVTRSSVKNPLLRLIDMLFSIVKHRRSHPVVLIDTYSTSAYWFASFTGMLCTLLHLKYIPILRGGNLPSRLNGSSGSANLLFRKSFINIAVSGYMQHEFEKRGYPVRTIHNSIDISFYPFTHRNRLRPRLLWVRSFHSIYNPMMALKVLERIAASYPDAALCMIGPEKDNSLSKCKAYANNKKLNVSFTGKLSKTEWIGLSESYDIFINTTNVDNTPISVMEAMALGMPVVSTNAGGVSYLFRDGIEGLLCGTDNLDEMVASVDRLLKNHQTASEISMAARKKALQWNWDEVAAQWKQLLIDAGG